MDIEIAIKEAIAEELNEKESLKEFTGSILSALKAVGGTVATFYLFQNLIKKIFDDKKFINNFALKVADRLAYLRKKETDRILNPTTPIALKGYGIVDVPNYPGKGHVVRMGSIT